MKPRPPASKSPPGNGGAFSSGAAKPFRVSFLDNPSAGLTASLVRRWERGEIPEPLMSASSGPKDYVCNKIWTIFDRYPQVAAVLMLRGEYARSIPFLVMVTDAGQVIDMLGEEVVVEP